jgi:uncharacterized protein
MEIKKKILNLIKEFNLLKSVNFIILYGSVSQKKENVLSDIDICISFNLNPKERIRTRMQLLGNLPENFDLQIFEDLPIYLKKEILKGKVLYCKNKKKLIQLSFEIIKEYEDFKPLYELYLSRNRSKVEI